MPSRPFSLLAAAFISLHCAVSAADWPRWRGSTVDNHVPAGGFEPEKLPADPQALWRMPLGEGYGSCVVAGGRVFVLDKSGTNEMLHAFAADNGKEIWKQPIDEVYEDLQGKGPRSTPLVDGDRVYATSCRGEFQCRRVTDGQLLWRKSFVQDFDDIFIGEKPNPMAIGASRHGNNGSPLIDGDRILVQAGGTNGASVVALKKTTGELVWKSENDQPGYAGAYIAKIDGARQLICFTALGVIGLDPDNGALLWRFPIKTTWARHVTTPVVVGNIVMVSSHQHGIFGIEVVRDGKGWAASQKWLTKEAAINFASPVVVDGFLYGLGPARNLICVDPATGKIAWSKDGYITSAAGKAHAAILVFKKSLLVLADNGQLIQLAIDPKECREISRAQVCGMNWCNPAYVDGVLYVRDNKSVTAVSLK